MITFRLWWRVLFNVRTEPKTDLLLKRVEKALDVPLLIHKKNPCDECDRHYEANFETQHVCEGSDMRVAVFEIFQIVYRMGGGWQVGYPLITDEGELDFCRSRSAEDSSGFAVPGMTWASFTVLANSFQSGNGRKTS